LNISFVFVSSSSSCLEIRTEDIINQEESKEEFFFLVIPQKWSSNSNKEWESRRNKSTEKKETLRPICIFQEDFVFFLFLKFFQITQWQNNEEDKRREIYSSTNKNEHIYLAKSIRYRLQWTKDTHTEVIELTWTIK